MSFSVFSLVFVVFFAVIIWLTVRAYVQRKREGSLPERKLDIAGSITNIILCVLYIPLSVFGCMFGPVVSEGCMFDTTAAQETLCRIISVLGAVTPVVAVGSIVASILLRRRGRSVLSFVIQFFPLLYAMNLIVLYYFLEISRGTWI